MSNKIELVKGDITSLEIEAVVNAANSSLAGGGGVDGAIHAAAGPKLHDECMRIVKKQGGCPTGDAVLTSAGNMPSKYVIHAVGPVWGGGKAGEADLLARTYRNSLDTADLFGIKEVAFPNISTGVYGFPKPDAARIAIDTVNEYISENDSIERVVFCCFDEENYRIYEEILGKSAGNSDE
ncbi:MAG: O-acetyl-ADP-ribose deacetylase [Candidatus Kapaibacterium sp.]